MSSFSPPPPARSWKTCAIYRSVSLCLRGGELHLDLSFPSTGWGSSAPPTWPPPHPLRGAPVPSTMAVICRTTLLLHRSTRPLRQLQYDSHCYHQSHNRADICGDVERLPLHWKRKLEECINIEGVVGHYVCGRKESISTGARAYQEDAPLVVKVYDDQRGLISPFFLLPFLFLFFFLFFFLSS